ncbi:Scramblase family protein [Desulfatibacillum aliphaticivorans]|uniref:Scramblase family protein n=1 Tax=Desulfatibacillum aliphaticivorans TaxID=218208 RepID=B8F977_DESAL|nr:phospholipid scramblase-related protein [Desulfatibacillum aliphaticivorans]ACL02823.1 Scramblase family protein [Desulfatibacillum aliphaticivorans]
MRQLESLDTLLVQQKKEWIEIVTDFETKNAYTVFDVQGRELYTAVEDGGFFLWRWILKALRPFTILLLSLDQRPELKVRRYFRFWFHTADIFDGSDRLLGTIKRRFSILRKKYSVLDPSGNEIYRLFGPILHPWTFNILDEQDQEQGKITKKWSGLLTEGFTDADNFGVVFPRDWPVERKALFLGAVFLIDFVHFENQESGNRR